MTRFATAAALGALILTSSAAFAAHRTPVNYIERCNSLESQWKSALDSHETSRHLGRAKAEAARGERFCRSHKISQQQRGVTDYRAALKLLGVRPA